MVIYLAEKKVLAEAIADALGGGGNTSDGVIYRGDAAVTWLSGHLLTLKEPEKYNEKYKSWNLDDLPIYFDPWENDVPLENKKRVDQLRSLIKNADLVVNCGDVDEEGQLLVDEMLRYVGYHGPCKRLDTANTTVDALKKALSRMKDNKDCENDGWSAYAREVSDITFGINLTRFFSKKFNAKLPVGRVQTPTLGLVVNRDKAIEGHKKVYYYTLGANVDLSGNSLNLRYKPVDGLDELTDGKFLQEDFLKHLEAEITGSRKHFSVVKKQKQELPPLPFNLTTLNKYCGSAWGYKPDDVMRITQSLRDNHSAITYNRSDCQYLSSEHYAEAPETIASVCRNIGTDKGKYDPGIKSKCFNDKYITAHFAIIPTNAIVDVNKLSSEERNIYLAICNIYLAQFMKPCIAQITGINAPVSMNGREIGCLQAASRKVLFKGWREIFDDKDEDDEEKEQGKNDALNDLSEGTYDGKIISCDLTKKETKPPKRYTQTSLYEDMTRISKYVDDPKIKELLLKKDEEKKGENGSIGTSATRAEIIKKLIRSGYLEECKDGKKEYLKSTEKGRQFYNILPDSIKKANTTALWWVVQEDIKNGEADYRKLTESVIDTIKSVMNGFDASHVDASSLSDAARPLCKCPSCGGDVLRGKFGPYCKCGFKMGKVFGKPITETQFINLCLGKKVKIKGIAKKDGSGSFDAFAVPKGTEEYSFDKDGKHFEGKRLKIEMAFK